MCISIGIYHAAFASIFGLYHHDGRAGAKGVPYNSPTALEFGGKFDLTSAYAFVVHLPAATGSAVPAGKQPCRRRHVSDTSHPVVVAAAAAAAAAAIHVLVLTADY
jgi:hypothetical protein